jgi:hypothetical protein
VFDELWQLVTQTIRWEVIPGLQGMRRTLPFWIILILAVILILSLKYPRSRS